MPLPLVAKHDREFPTLDWYPSEEKSLRVVQDGIREFGVERGATVLDLFCESGTALVAARLIGRNALGIETNPFLHLVASIKLRSDLDLPALQTELDSLIRDAHLLLTGNKIGRQVSEAPRIVGVERWLSGRVASKVMALEDLIKGSVTPANQDIPMLALASILHGVSNLKLSPHAFGSRSKSDAPVLYLFRTMLNRMVADMGYLSAQPEWQQTKSVVAHGDAGEVNSAGYDLPSVSLAAGVPPRLGSMDSALQTRLEISFLDLAEGTPASNRPAAGIPASWTKVSKSARKDWRRAEQSPMLAAVTTSIGDKLNSRVWGHDPALAVRQYFGALLRTLESTKPLLEKGAPLVLILSDRVVYGVPVPVPAITAELACIAGYSRTETHPLRTGGALPESAVVVYA